MSDEVKLLPCPFGCGDVDALFVTYDTRKGCVVLCNACGALGPSCHTEAEAIAAWNTRAIEATRPTDEVVESVKASLEDVFYDTLDCAFDADILARAAIAAMKDDAHD